MSTKTRRFIGVVVVLIVLAVLAGTLFNGSEPKTTEVSGNDIATEIASLKKQIAQVYKQNDDLKKRVVILWKKRVAMPARKLVPATAKAPTPTPIVKAPESATKMLKAMGMKAQTEDRIIKVWTGRPAIIHELARANAKKAEAQKPACARQTVSNTVRGARLARVKILEALAENAKWKATEFLAKFGPDNSWTRGYQEDARIAEEVAAKARAEVDE